MFKREDSFRKMVYYNSSSDKEAAKKIGISAQGFRCWRAKFKLKSKRRIGRPKGARK